MTKMIVQKLACPNCGEERDTEVWDSINVSINPELREKLFKTEINVFNCEKCSCEAFVNSPLLYNDMARKFCVQFYPGDLVEEDTFMEHFNRDGFLKISNSMDKVEGFLGETGGEYLLRPHIVFDMNEMIRYIVFRERVFDMQLKPN